MKTNQMLQILKEHYLICCVSNQVCGLIFLNREHHLEMSMREKKSKSILSHNRYVEVQATCLLRYLHYIQKFFSTYNITGIYENGQSAAFPSLSATRN